MVVDMDSPQGAVTSFLTCNKIQDGGRIYRITGSSVTATAVLP